MRTETQSNCANTLGNVVRTGSETSTRVPACPRAGVDREPARGIRRNLRVGCVEPAASASSRKSTVRPSRALLEQGATPEGRVEIIEKSGISDKLILEWINRADLFRIKGVGEEYADLLEAAGVDTVPELAQRNPENLYQKLVEVNEEKEVVRRPPTQTQVQDWVEQAKGLPRVITY